MEIMTFTEWSITECCHCKELIKIKIRDIESLQILYATHLDSNPACKVYHDSLPTLSKLLERLPTPESEDTSKVRLYELSACVSYNVVIAAVSEADALKQVETWEHAWDANADLIEVSELEVFDVRDVEATDVDDEAHEVTDSAKKLLKE